LKKDIQKIIVLNKKEGETPLEALSLFRSTHKSFKDVPMTYAGRLDPMASGLLVILIGEECKKKDEYLKLDKEYEFDVLLGFATDTYDILGKVISKACKEHLDTLNAISLEKEILKNLKYFKGTFIQKYPIYSSRTVNGKPLFEYGREGKDVEIPEREVHVKSLKFLKLRKINNKKLLENIEKRINKVHGDFRQKDILNIWHKELKNKKQVFYIGSFKMRCRSGTYVRGIAQSLGEKIGLPALAYTIKRTKIGKYDNV
jgi:tRNA pseudouridine55 synthase